MIVIPDTQSQEKKDMIRLCGAELIEVPAVPYRDPNNYVRYSGRLAEALDRALPNGAIWANQFDNVANRDGHIRTTGPEIWRQTEGKIDAFVSAVGTGGTLAGVGIALKERNRDVKIVLADPDGAALYNYYAHGELKAEGVVDHRGHRPGADHREPRGCAGRHVVQHQGQGRPAADLRLGGR